MNKLKYEWVVAAKGRKNEKCVFSLTYPLQIDDWNKKLRREGKMVLERGA